MNKIAKCFFGNPNEEKINNISNKILYKNMESEDNFLRSLCTHLFLKFGKFNAMNDYQGKYKLPNQFKRSERNYQKLLKKILKAIPKQCLSFSKIKAFCS